jgi:hypothetical protein
LPPSPPLTPPRPALPDDSAATQQWLENTAWIVGSIIVVLALWNLYMCTITRRRLHRLVAKPVPLPPAMIVPTKLIHPATHSTPHFPSFPNIDMNYMNTAALMNKTYPIAAAPTAPAAPAVEEESAVEAAQFDAPPEVTPLLADLLHVLAAHRERTLKKGEPKGCARPRCAPSPHPPLGPSSTLLPPTALPAERRLAASSMCARVANAPFAPLHVVRRRHALVVRAARAPGKDDSRGGPNGRVACVHAR